MKNLTVGRGNTAAVRLIAAVGLVFVGVAFVGQGREDALQGVAANGGYIFRVYESGRVEFLQLGNPVTAKGVPGWTELRIDHGRKSQRIPPY